MAECYSAPAPAAADHLGSGAVTGLSVCVFCSSSDRVAAAYHEVAADLGRGIAARGWSLVYGGGRSGLMGTLARAALAGGARVTGVLPDRLIESEIALDGLSELVRTTTMRERKAQMDAAADAFVVLPGGIGTLEELVEVVTLKALGYHRRPIIVVDAAGYWDPLLAQVAAMVDEGFAHGAVMDLFRITTTVAATLELLATPPADEPSPPPLLLASEAAPTGPGAGDRPAPAPRNGRGRGWR